MSIVAIDQIVKELCNETGEPGLQNYDTLLGKVLDGIRDLSIFNMPIWKAEQVDLNGYNAICWPNDCVKPLAVVLERNGRKIALDVSDDIYDTVGAVNKVTISDVNNEVGDFFRNDGYYQDWYSLFNWGLGEVYGLNTGYGNSGVATHNKDRKQTIVQGVTLKDEDKLWFFYKSDGLGDATQCVPSECKEAIEYFALSKYFRTRNPNLGSLNRENYKQEFYRLQRLYADESEQAWAKTMLSNVKSSPKI
jgi:hypothetical protein